VTVREDRAQFAALVERCETDLAHVSSARETGDAYALELGGELGLRWRIAVVRAVMAAPPDGDAVRELYGELVDRYRNDPESLAIVKPLGDQIRKLEREGALPSTLVVRSDRRKR
jgi:hypothetical protein